LRTIDDRKDRMKKGKDRLQRVLFVEHTAEMIGGGQQSLLVLLGKLDRERFAPVVVLPEDGSLAERLSDLKIPCRILPFGSFRTFNLPTPLRAILRLYRVLREERIDIVHTNASRSTFYAGFAARAAGVPLIWHVRIARPDGLYDRLLYALATRVITISHAVANRFPWDDGRKVSVVYNGLDTDLYLPGGAEGLREKFRLRDKIIVGLVGRVEPDKGGRELIEALREARTGTPRLHLLIVGPPTPYQRELEDEVRRMGLPDAVTFAGYRKDVPQVMSSIDILALPSRSEAFGRVLIEAMACAKPVVAFSVDAVPEVVEDGVTGLLVPRGDIDALAGAILKLAEDPLLRARMGEKGRERAERCFGIGEHVRRVESLYEEVLAS